MTLFLNLLLTILVTQILFQPRAMATTLEELWTQMMSSDGEIKAVQARQSANRNMAERMPGYISPRLQIGAQVLRTENGIVGVTSYNKADASVTGRVEQDLINNPNSYEKRINAATLGRDDVQLESVRRQKAKQLLPLYLEAMRLKTRLEVASGILRDLMTQKETLGEQVKIRTRTVVDLERLKLQIDQRKILMAQDQIALEQRLVELRQLSRLPEVSLPKFEVVDPEALIAQIGNPRREVPDPEWDVNQSEIRILKETSEQALGIYKPTLTLFADTSWNNTLQTNVPLETTQKVYNINLGLRVTWNIMDGQLARIASWKAMTGIAERQSFGKSIRINEQFEIVKAQKVYAKSVKTYALSQSLITSSQRLLRAAEQSANSGLTDRDIVFQIQNESADGRLTIVDSVFSILSSWVNVCAQKGQIDVALVAKIDSNWFKPSTDTSLVEPPF